MVKKSTKNKTVKGKDKKVKKLGKDIMKNKEKAEPKASKKKSIDNNE